MGLKKNRISSCRKFSRVALIINHDYINYKNLKWKFVNAAWPWFQNVKNLENEDRQKNTTNGNFIVKAVRISYSKRRIKFAVTSCNLSINGERKYKRGEITLTTVFSPLSFTVAQLNSFEIDSHLWWMHKKRKFYSIDKSNSLFYSDSKMLKIQMNDVKLLKLDQLWSLYTTKFILCLKFNLEMCEIRVDFVFKR